MKKEVKRLYNKAVDSLTLSIELFNRPSNSGRVCGVLIFMDHSFEMLLKAAILYKKGKIKVKGSNETIGFSSCIRKAYSDSKIKFLIDMEVLTLQTLNGLRDAEQHYILEISEQHLYFQAQTGLTLFRDIVKKVFNIDLKDEMPVRVLPISTTPPMDIQAFFTSELDDIRKIIQPKNRRSLEATEKIRSLAIMEHSIQGNESQPSDTELKELLTNLKSGATWDVLFPGVSTLNFTQNGYGPSLDLRIVKTDGLPVTLVPEGTPGGSVVAIKRVNELDYYNLTLKTLAPHVKLSMNKLGAVIKELQIQDNPNAFKVIKLGSQTHKRYSALALDIIRKELPGLNIEEIWAKHRPISGGRKKRGHHK